MWIGQPRRDSPNISRIPRRCGAMIVPFGRLSNGISRIARAAGRRNRQLTAKADRACLMPTGIPLFRKLVRAKNEGDWSECGVIPASLIGPTCTTKALLYAQAGIFSLNSRDAAPAAVSIYTFRACNYMKVIPHVHDFVRVYGRRMLIRRVGAPEN